MTRRVWSPIENQTARPFVPRETEGEPMRAVQFFSGFVLVCAVAGCAATPPPRVADGSPGASSRLSGICEAAEPAQNHRFAELGK